MVNAPWLDFVPVGALGTRMVPLVEWGASPTTCSREKELEIRSIQEMLFPLRGSSNGTVAL